MKDIKPRLAQIKAANQLYRTPVSQFKQVKDYTLINSQTYPSDYGMDLSKCAYTESAVVEMLCIWLSHSLEYTSKEFRTVFSSLSYKHVKKSLALLDLQMQVITDEFTRIKKAHIKRAGAAPKDVFVDSVIYYGGTLYTNEPVKLGHWVTAIKLLKGIAPFSNYLYNLINSHYAANSIDFEPVSTVLPLIDFPITSVSNLIQSLGLKYIDNSLFMSEDIVLGAADGWFVIWMNADRSWFKVGELEGISEILDQHLATVAINAESMHQFKLVACGNGEPK
ncbi:MAG: hypothetical protein RSC43_00410 [Clostridia bacterium]